MCPTIRGTDLWLDDCMIYGWMIVRLDYCMIWLLYDCGWLWLYDLCWMIYGWMIALLDYCMIWLLYDWMTMVVWSMLDDLWFDDYRIGLLCYRRLYDRVFGRLYDWFMAGWFYDWMMVLLDDLWFPKLEGCWLRTALFWSIMRRVVVIPDGRFGTACRSRNLG